MASITAHCMAAAEALNAGLFIFGLGQAVLARVTFGHHNGVCELKRMLIIIIWVDNLLNG